MVLCYHLYLNLCPFCGHTHLIRWGYYYRHGLPLFSDVIKIQRIRCKRCKRTTNVLPSFLLAHRTYHVDALKELVTKLIDNPYSWHKTLKLTIDIDLATAYRWLGIFKKQIIASLPEIRKTLLKFKPDVKIKHDYDGKPVEFAPIEHLIQRFLYFSEKLLKALVRLVDENPVPFTNVYCFLNYFLARNTGKALLVA